MPGIVFELAREEDDAALRRLLRDNPMSGRISVSMEREPCYFTAAAIEGPFHQVAVARDEETGEVVGMGTRSVRPMFLNGEVRDVGYLSQLRVFHRAGKAAIARGLARGFEFMKQLHADGHAPFYLTSIVSDNVPARKLLTAGLPGYPRYYDYAPYNTYAIALGRKRQGPIALSGVEIRQAKANDVAAIRECLERNGSRRQFAPFWRQDILFDPFFTPDLHPEDFFVAVRGSKVVGCIACWNQTAFKQTVVRSYAGALGRCLPLVNTAAPIFGWPRLPDPGSALRSCYASHAAVDDDDPVLFAALLRRLFNHAVSLGFSYAMLGMSPTDPLSSVATAYRHVLYRSHLYLVAWGDGVEELRKVDNRTPGPEVAVL